MVTKDELRTLEQETRLGWLGLLVLAVKLYRFRSVEEPGSLEGGLISTILQGTEDLRPRVTGKTAVAQTEDKKAPMPTVALLLANPEEATSLAEAIQADGITAITVGSPEEASALCADENVKVCVIEEGFIKTNTDTWRFRKDRVLPVAVIGSRPEREGWDRVVQLDADAYLSKGISRAEQVARIKALLRRA